MQKQEFKGVSYQEITNATRTSSQSGNFENLIRFIDRTVKPIGSSAEMMTGKGTVY